MSYAPTGLSLIHGTVGGAGVRIWSYESADDDATVNGTDYFSDAEDKGMQVGDLVVVYDTATPKTSLCYVNAIDADGNGTTAFAAVA